MRPLKRLLPQGDDLRSAVRADRLLTGGLLPILVFYGAVRLWALGPAVALGVLSAAAIAAYRLVRERRPEPVSASTFVITVVVGLLALRLGEPNVFLLEPAVSNLVVGVVFVGSVAVRRPLLAAIVPLFYRRSAPYAASPAGTYGFGVVTLAWGILNLARGAFRAYLAVRLGTGDLLLANVILGWPVSGPLALASYFYLYWHARRTAPSWSPVEDADAAAR